MKAPFVVQLYAITSEVELGFPFFFLLLFSDILYLVLFSSFLLFDFYLCCARSHPFTDLSRLYSLLLCFSFLGFILPRVIDFFRFLICKVDLGMWDFDTIHMKMWSDT